MGLGVTAAASGLQGSVEGQADVQAEQALTVTDVSVVGRLDADFTRVSDDNTSFQAVAELNNGDSVAFVAEVENSAADELAVQVTVDSPNPIDIDVRNGDASNDNDSFSDVTSAAGNDVTDIDPVTSETDAALQTGEGTFVAKITGNESEGVGIFAELDDTADPGSYDIGVAINPLSSDS